MNSFNSTERRAGWSFLLVFAFLAAGIVTGGYFYHRSYERHYRAEVERQLSAIAELKVAQIVQWRRERLADANMIHATPYYARRALDALAQPDSAGTRQMFTGALAPLLANLRYERVLLLDEQLNVRLVHPENGSRTLAGAVRGPAEQALRTRQVVMADLQRAADGGPVYLDLLVPLVVRRQGANDNVPAAGLDPSPADRSAGVLVLQVNAQDYLFPLIQTWPTASRSAETLLVRREGNEVVFLNELRFQTNTALNLRAPLDRVGLPAALAALGREGIMEGVDYRGVPVVAITRAILDSPWSLVARMDTAEVYAPIRERLWEMIVLIGALLFGTGASVGLVWRQQHVRSYREKAESAEALRQTRDHLENLFNHANAPIIVWDPQFKITRFNHAFESLTGRRADEVVGQSLELLFPSALVDGSMALIKKTTGGERWETVEIDILHLDGSVRIVLWNSATIFAPDGKTPMTTIAQGQDITERKRAEEQLRTSELRFRRAVVDSPFPILLHAEDGAILQASNSWCEISGYTREELATIGDWTERAYGERKTLVQADLDALYGLDHRKSEGDYTIRTKRGDTRIWEFSSAPLGRLPDGRRLVISMALDVTERREAEARLAEAKAFLQAALDNSQAGIAIADAPSGKLRYVNRAGLLIRGASEAEAVLNVDINEYVSRWQLLRLDGTPLALEEVPLARAVQFGEPCSREFIIHRAEHDDRIVLAQAAPIRDREGKVTAGIVVFLDITEHKQIEATLLASEARYRRLFETTKDGILILDAGTGMVVDVNPFLIELLGFSREEFLGKKVWELGFFKDIVANQDNFAELQQKEYIRYEDMALETSDGRRIEVEFTSNVYRVDNQKVIQCAIRDISERKRAEAKKRASEVRYRRLFETTKDGILILDAGTGMIVDVNPFLIEMLGFSREEFLGKKVWELGFFKDIVANQDNFAELQQKEYIRYEDKPLETGDGRRIEVEFISNVYQVNHEKVIQCNIRDISERKRAEEKIKSTLADLERSNRELEQFASVASHDLQEPLRMVASFTQLLAQRYESQLDDKARKYIAYAVDGATRMHTLINDLLAYSRVGSRGKPLEPTDSHAVLGEALRNLAATIAENLALITNDDLPTVRTDASQLVLVFQNLIANAIKFRRTDFPHVHVSARDQGHEWVFAVRDNGIGIEPQHAERVFVIFQRLHTREQYPGTGIGLAVCRRIVERHGGRIWFESEPGNGSTFFFTVPK